ncbi:PREDICTED: uncharacterized protein LOC109327330 [Lupinus angustifolius]|uniref:uncharacterized protein LOC109327330 n=1 Tax=Lupinus angustifolius TaxID=3871 RepID=UPI00092EB9F4|nr:PREDICTED: uncharacterized protein LOC109327330 [Lupinus angustifolius]
MATPNNEGQRCKRRMLLDKAQKVQWRHRTTKDNDANGECYSNDKDEGCWTGRSNHPGYSGFSRSNPIQDGIRAKFALIRLCHFSPPSLSSIISSFLIFNHLLQPSDFALQFFSFSYLIKIASTMSQIITSQSNYSDYIINPSNAFFLHSTENPALVLVSPLLNGKNYHSWARGINLAIESKNKIQFIDGSIPKPLIDDILYRPWIRCNTMVLSWLQHSVQESIVKSILWMDSAAQVWKDLRERFSQGDIFWIAELQEEFYRQHQGNLNVFDFHTQLQTIWEEIETFRPIGTCKCAVYGEHDYVIRFLKGLKEQYSQVRSQIMLLESLPSMSKVFSMVIQQERQFEHPSNHELEPKVLFVNSQQTNQYRGTNTNPNFSSFRRRGGSPSRGRNGRFTRAGRGQGNKFCTYCKRTNHTIDTCFLKHGYPPGYQSSRPNRRPNIFALDKLDTTYTTDTQEEPHDLDENQLNDQTFTKEQFKDLLNIIHQSKSNSTHAANSAVNTTLPAPCSSNLSLQWLLDTGAIDHITFDSRNLTSKQNISPILITLPNGNKVSTLFLSNVLLEPEFHVNLVSFNKLMHDSQCHLIFSQQSCTILQNNSK